MKTRLHFLIPFLFLLLVASSVTSCVIAPPMQINPAWEGCKTQCIEEKNNCMIEAASSAAIKICDSGISSCLEVCSQIPSYIPIENN